MNERNQENRLRGIKKAGAVLAVSLAACSGDKTPATSTPSLPNETLPPSLVVPTEQPTPVVTTMPTPDITPAPTLTPLTSLFEGKITKPNIKTVASDIKAVIEKNPQSINSVWTEKLYLDGWKLCYDLSNDNAPRENACEALIRKLYQDYQSFKDPAFYSAAKEVYNYAAKTFDTYTLNILKQNLQ